MDANLKIYIREVEIYSNHFQLSSLCNGPSSQICPLYSISPLGVISIVKAHTIKWQIYPDEVFYMKDLLPARVTI